MLKHDFSVMHGIHKARVEYNKDPNRVGRVRIRVPYLHGVKGQANFIEPDKLPWAYPCVPGFAGEDFGSFLVPPVGTYVWVLFQYTEQNNPDSNYPVYLGGSYGVKPSSPKQMNTFNDEDDMSMGAYFTEGSQEETPLDAFDGKGSDYPESGIIFKSPKGHTIVYNDTDGEEGLSFLDRLGQAVHFHCPVSVGDNVGNASKRNTASALKDTQRDEEREIPYIVIKSGLNSKDPEYTYVKVYRDKSVTTTVHSITGNYSRIESNYGYSYTEVSDRENITKTHRTADKILTEAFDHDGSDKSMQDVTKERQIFETDKSKVTIFKERVHATISEGKNPEVDITPDSIDATIDGSEVLLDGDNVFIKVNKGLNCEVKVTASSIEMKVGSSFINISSSKIELNASSVEINGSVFEVNSSVVNCAGQEECHECSGEEEEDE